jgi:hypothetical protein
LTATAPLVAKPSTLDLNSAVAAGPAAVVLANHPAHPLTN